MVEGGPETYRDEDNGGKGGKNPKRDAGHIISVSGSVSVKKRVFWPARK